MHAPTFQAAAADSTGRVGSDACASRGMSGTAPTAVAAKAAAATKAAATKVAVQQSRQSTEATVSATLFASSDM